MIYDKKAELNLRRIDRLGFNDFAICMAKTQKSFSDDDKLIGRPTGFKVTVREIEIAAGAQFIIPILGKMMRMPGLPATPASENMSIDNDGVMKGYDINLLDSVREKCSMPMTVLGGAGSLNDIKGIISKFKIIGVSAGSLFVFKGRYKAVLINYPNREERKPLY